MKYVLAVAISMLLGCTFAVAQQIEPKTESTPAGAELAGMTVQLTPYGYIELPRGYWAYMEKDYMDAWTGYIEKFDATSKIYFAAGLIQSPFEVYKDPMEWTKTLKIGDREFAYLLVKTNEIKRVIVSVGSDDFFDFGIKDEAEIDGFLKIIGKYRKGRCESCLNSRWTKGLRKSLEKRFGEK